MDDYDVRNVLKYSKVRDVKSPFRAHETDAGIDFFVPTSLLIEDIEIFNPVMSFDDECFKIIPEINLNKQINYNKNKIERIVIEPHGKIKIPSGIHVNVPEGWAMVAHNKSGISTNKGLLKTSEVIDHGYQGEVIIGLFNYSNHHQIIIPGMKVIQYLLIPIGDHIPVETEFKNLYKKTSERNIRGFGSTDFIESMRNFSTNDFE